MTWGWTFNLFLLGNPVLVVIWMLAGADGSRTHLRHEVPPKRVWSPRSPPGPICPHFPKAYRITLIKASQSWVHIRLGRHQNALPSLPVSGFFVPFLAQTWICSKKSSKTIPKTIDIQLEKVYRSYSKGGARWMHIALNAELRKKWREPRPLLWRTSGPPPQGLARPAGPKCSKLAKPNKIAPK
jgi:hypothetical protein